jgi:hypothetical protein
MMRMRSSSRWSVAIWTPLCALLALAFPGAAGALKAPPPQLSELEEADRKALETIAGHSEPLRDAVLEASLHLDALVETQRIQEQSSASFQERIGKLDKKEQEQIWEIVREPGLLDELATEERPSRSDLDEIAERHPEELAPAIRSVGAKHHDLLVDVAQTHRRASERFDVAISDLDPKAQQAFRDLVEQPELLSVLVRRVNLVVKLGDSYRKNPRDTRTYLAALSSDVAKRNAAAEKEWKERIEKDPDAAAELERAARDYSAENGYDYEELTSPAARSRVTVVVRPYPYWFGYPYWYSDAYLYPYGYWYPYRPYFGYYWYGGSYVWWGAPAWPFVHWFYWGHHHHHYGHLHGHFHGHFANHRWAGHRYAAANRFVGRSDPVDGHRADWAPGRGGRSAGPGGRANVGTASASGADRRFFDRNSAQDGFSRNVGRTGRTGRALTDPSRGSDRSTGLVRSGRGRGELQMRDATGSSISPQNDRGTAARGRGRGRLDRSPVDQAPRFFQRSEPTSGESRASAPRQGGPGRSRERGVEVIRGSGRSIEPSARNDRGIGGATPSVDSGPPASRRDGGGLRGRSGGGERRGFSAPSGEGRGSRGQGWSGGGGSGGSSSRQSVSGGGGGSRGRAWSNGGSSGGGRSFSGGNRGGGGRSFSGGNRGGGGRSFSGGGGGRGGGGFGGGGRGGGGGGRGR